LAALAGAHGASQLISVAFLTLLSFSAFEATFSLFGHSRLGFDVGSSAAVFAAIGLVIVVVQGGLVHPVVMRLGELTTLRAGLAAEVVGLLALAFVHTWAALAPALLVLTVGQGLVQTTMTSALAGRAPPQRRGAVLGAQQSAGGLARVIGPLLGGILFEQIGPGAPYVVGAALVAVCLLLLQSAVSPAATTTRP
jgi:predicted MFS family arabinose efflux permease